MTRFFVSIFYSLIIEKILHDSTNVLFLMKHSLIFLVKRRELNSCMNIKTVYAACIHFWKHHNNNNNMFVNIYIYFNLGKLNLLRSWKNSSKKCVV